MHLLVHLQTYFFLKSQVGLLQTAHSWANAGVFVGWAHASGVAVETINLSGWSLWEKRDC